jgi:hypothetical protein
MMNMRKSNLLSDTVENAQADLEKLVSDLRGVLSSKDLDGVPDIKHPWVNTDPSKFESYIEHLKAEGCKVIAMRNLASYVSVKR